MAKVLRLDIRGMPRAWISCEEAVRLYYIGAVVWTLGDVFRRMHGGTSARSGTQSYCDLHSIVATRGVADVDTGSFAPTLTRHSIYARDRGICMYCGEHVAYWDSTIDHIVPRCRGGKTTFMNVVLAHRACNMRKGAKTPEEAGMPLVAAPYVPSRVEQLLLAAGHKVLADQMEYLRSRAGRQSRLLAA